MTSRKEVSGLPKEKRQILDGRFNDASDIFDDVMMKKKQLILNEVEAALLEEEMPNIMISK